MAELLWRFRVLAWRIAPLLFLVGCTSKLDEIHAIEARCVAEIRSAANDDEARAINARCHDRLDGVR